MPELVQIVGEKASLTDMGSHYLTLHKEIRRSLLHEIPRPGLRFAATSLLLHFILALVLTRVGILLRTDGISLFLSQPLQLLLVPMLIYPPFHWIFHFYFEYYKFNATPRVRMGFIGHMFAWSLVSGSLAVVLAHSEMIMPTDTSLDGTMLVHGMICWLIAVVYLGFTNYAAMSLITRRMKVLARHEAPKFETTNIWPFILAAYTGCAFLLVIIV